MFTCYSCAIAPSYGRIAVKCFVFILCSASLIHRYNRFQTFCDHVLITCMWWWCANCTSSTGEYSPCKRSFAKRGLYKPRTGTPYAPATHRPRDCSRREHTVHQLIQLRNSEFSSCKMCNQLWLPESSTS